MLRLPRKLAQFRALSSRDRRTFLAAMALLPLFWVGLHVLGLQRLQTWLQHKPRPVAATLSTEELERLGALINSAAHHTLGPANCLTRSLYLWWLLQRKGIACQLRIGVRLTGDVLEAHAWVEHAGIPINDRPDVSTNFAPFADPVSPSLFSAP